jgi:hypothetical protein
MQKSNPAQWEALYSAYVAAHQDYLEVKMLRAAAPVKQADGPLSDDALGSFAAGKLEKAHRSMHEFLEAYPSLLDTGKGKVPARQTRRVHPTDETVAHDRSGVASVAERPLALV